MQSIGKLKESINLARNLYTYQAKVAVRGFSSGFGK